MRLFLDIQIPDPNEAEILWVNYWLLQPPEVRCLFIIDPAHEVTCRHSVVIPVLR